MKKESHELAQTGARKREWDLVKKVARDLHAAGIQGFTRDRMWAGPHEAPMGLVVGSEDTMQLLPFTQANKDHALKQLRAMVREKNAGGLVVLYRAALAALEEGASKSQFFDTVAVVVEGGPRFHGRGFVMAQAVEWKDGVITLLSDPHEQDYDEHSEEEDGGVRQWFDAVGGTA